MDSDSECESPSSRPLTSEEELRLPRAAMNKLIKELCPTFRVSNDTRDLLLACCSEFVRLISSEANENCGQQQKKTISAEHVLQALDTLGFRDYRSDCDNVLMECKSVQANKRRRQSDHRLDRLGIPEEELVRQQQELFARARMAIAQQEANVAMQHQRIVEDRANVHTNEQQSTTTGVSVTAAFDGNAAPCPPAVSSEASLTATTSGEASATVNHEVTREEQHD